MKLQSVFWSLISQQWGVQVECIVQSQYNIMNYIYPCVLLFAIAKSVL